MASLLSVTVPVGQRPWVVGTLEEQPFTLARVLGVTVLPLCERNSPLMSTGVEQRSAPALNCPPLPPAKSSRRLDIGESGRPENVVVVPAAASETSPTSRGLNTPFRETTTFGNPPGFSTSRTGPVSGSVSSGVTAVAVPTCDCGGQLSEP